jgi:DUF1365 family protein
MESALYFGTLRHRRFTPVRHEFTYGVHMAFLDIDRIPEILSRSALSSYNRFNWTSFHERDHFGDPAKPLRARLAESAAEAGIHLPAGPIFLLTNLRYLGYCFNPISLFYCMGDGGCMGDGECMGESQPAILAEVHNTFGETRLYWLSGANRIDSDNSLRFRCRKTMHVSPFNEMGLDYDFVLTPPGERLVAHMNTIKEGNSFFDATLTMERKPWTASNLHAALLRHPWMTLKVISAIHWEALRLFLKGAPVFTHPDRIHDSRKTLPKDA